MQLLINIYKFIHFIYSDKKYLYRMFFIRDNMKVFNLDDYFVSEQDLFDD